MIGFRKRHYSKQIIKSSGFLTNHNVLLYGDISKQLVKQTLKTISPNGKLYIIGRNKEFTRFNKYTRGKFENRVILNPFFDDLPSDSLHHILVANASINIQIVKPLAEKARDILIENGQLIVIDGNISRSSLIALENQISWFKHIPDSKLLIFKKQ